MRHLILGTAGHIDHGKSALVKALTGVDPDRLKEEQLRGITIDLGFAHLELEGVQIAFVDVPGHEKFVKNMLAGAGGIDSVLLVVAADESIMPQTREHFDICRLLGVSSGIVAITKTDLVEPDLVELVREEIRQAVRGSFLERADVIPVSSRTGAGLEDLKASLRTLALAAPQRPTDRPFRLPVDRAFTMRGFGTVVTGTMVAGQLKKEEEVELIPGGPVAKIRGIQVHGRASDLAVAGQRTAVNLQGVDLAEVERGMTLTVPRIFQTAQLLDVRIDLLPSAKALKNLSRVRFHHGTAEVLARVALLGPPELGPGKTALAQLRLDRPVFCLHGDAFIIRQFSPATTIGGGRILNPLAGKHKVTDRRVLSLLQSLEQVDMPARLSALVALHPGQMAGMRELNAALGLAPADLQSQCARAAEAGAVRIIPAPQPILAVPEVIESLKQGTVSLVERFHRDNPLLRGISREELRKRAYDRVPPEVFRYCLDQLAEEHRISLQEDMVAAHGRDVQMAPAELRIKEMVQELLQKAQWQPPSLTEIAALVPADPAEVRRICSWMLREKILVRVAEDIVYCRTTIEEMKDRIRRRYRPGAKFGVAEFKELFDLTRKHAIPLLEQLDRERFTRRQGSERILL